MGARLIVLGMMRKLLVHHNNYNNKTSHTLNFTSPLQSLESTSCPLVWTSLTAPQFNSKFCLAEQAAQQGLYECTLDRPIRTASGAANAKDFPFCPGSLISPLRPSSCLRLMPTWLCLSHGSMICLSPRLDLVNFSSSFSCLLEKALEAKPPRFESDYASLRIGHRPSVFAKAVCSGV